MTNTGLLRRKKAAETHQQRFGAYARQLPSGAASSQQGENGGSKARSLGEP
jgi:hypothetical protein